MLSLVLQSVCLGGAVGKVPGVQQVTSSSSLQEVTATVTTLIATVMRWETAGEIDLCWTSGGGRDHNSPECVYAMVRHMIAVT